MSIDTSSSNDFKDILSSYRHQVLVNGTLVIHDVEKSDSGLYMCQVSNGIGAGLSKVVRIKVLSKLYIYSKSWTTCINLCVEKKLDIEVHVLWT